jgi:hypothetical protein
LRHCRLNVRSFLSHCYLNSTCRSFKPDTQDPISVSLTVPVYATAPLNSLPENCGIITLSYCSATPIITRSRRPLSIAFPTGVNTSVQGHRGQGKRQSSSSLLCLSNRSRKSPIAARGTTLPFLICCVTRHHLRLACFAFAAATTVASKFPGFWALALSSSTCQVAALQFTLASRATLHILSMMS